MNGLMMNQPLLISAQLEFAARFHSGQDVVTRTVEGPIVRTTWGHVAQRVKKLANALTALGVKQGDVVATLAWNTQRHLEVYFAVSSLGAVLHTINPRLPPEQLTYIAKDAGDKVLFFDTTFTPLAKHLGATSAIAHYFALTDDAHLPADSGVPGLKAYESFIKDFPDTITWPVLDENTASSLCYTSGTVGLPKGVLYSHRSTVLHSYAIVGADALAISAQDVTLPVVPMFHVNAWGVPYAAAMVGSKLVLPGPALDGKSLLELITQEKVTSALGVPTVWLGLLAAAKSAGVRMLSLKKVVIGGSAVPPSMIAQFEAEHAARVIHAWGMTELSPLGTANILLPKHDELSAEGKLHIQSKQGRPVFGVDLRIVDDAGAVLPHDGKTAGHLQTRGYWVASGYFNKPNEGQHTADGWFFTGDIATIDADGYMQITDRSKDVIKSGGEWISSIDLENAAMAHPQVAQAAAIGVPHERWAERPLLVVVRRDDKLTKEELREFLETKLVKWWLPDAIEFVDALPLGPTGKVLKRTLREKFADYKL